LDIIVNMLPESSAFIGRKTKYTFVSELNLKIDIPYSLPLLYIKYTYVYINFIVKNMQQSRLPANFDIIAQLRFELEGR